VETGGEILEWTINVVLVVRLWIEPEVERPKAKPIETPTIAIAMPAAHTRFTAEALVRQGALSIRASFKMWSEN
jgi:hypothetical protein